MPSMTVSNLWRKIHDTNLNILYSSFSEFCTLWRKIHDTNQLRDRYYVINWDINQADCIWLAHEIQEWFESNYSTPILIYS
jgi:hypothetical protein